MQPILIVADDDVSLDLLEHALTRAGDNVSGDPRGLQGQSIPLAGRIVALADVYDALSSRRIYKPAFTHEVARSMITHDSGTHFDPDVVEAFLEPESEFLAIYERFQTGGASGESPAARAPGETRPAVMA